MKEWQQELNAILSQTEDKKDIHDLYEKYYVKSEKSKTNSRKGLKYCPCGKYIGARNKICPHCNKEFKKGETYEKPKELTPEEKATQLYVSKLGVKGILVYTPVGECPFLPKSLTEEDVFDWCEELITYGQKNGRIYTVAAIKYFAATIFDRNSASYSRLIELIDRWVGYFNME